MNGCHVCNQSNSCRFDIHHKKDYANIFEVACCIMRLHCGNLKINMAALWLDFLLLCIILL